MRRGLRETLKELFCPDLIGKRLLGEDKKELA